MSAPSIAVGGGGRGAPGPQTGQPSTSEDGSLTEQIGKMAEDKQEQQPGGMKQGESKASKNSKAEEQHRQEQPRNPKKRMWDENVEAKKFEERQKDEL